MNQAAKRYIVRFGIAMVTYGIAIIVVFTIINRYPAAPWRFVLVLAPIIPGGFGLWAYVRFLRDVDELQRRIHQEAIVWGFGGTLLLTFAYGLLQVVGLPTLNWMYVLSLMTTLWGIGLSVATRRYQ